MKNVSMIQYLHSELFSSLFHHGRWIIERVLKNEYFRAWILNVLAQFYSKCYSYDFTQLLPHETLDEVSSSDFYFPDERGAHSRIENRTPSEYLIFMNNLYHV